MTGRLLLAGMLLALVPADLQAAQSADISLEGLVVSGSDSVPRAAIDVELHRITADSGGAVDETVSGADGSFLLSITRQEDSGAVLLGVARHLGISYFGPAVHSGADPPSPYVIQVFDTTAVASPQAADLVARRIVVTPGVDAEGRMSVAEVLDVRGPQDRALVRMGPGEPVWETVLPAGATAFAALPGAVPVEALSRRGDTLAVAAALTPMGLRIGFRYLVPGGPLRLPTPQAAAEFVVLVDESLGAADIPGFRRVSQGVAADSPGSSMARFARADVPSGSPVEIVINPRSAPGRTNAWVWLGLGALLIAAAAASAVWARGRPAIT
ncbi:MAG: hypothetical protein ABFS14_03490 [Gemmatimonadota bacterium]